MKQIIKNVSVLALSTLIEKVVIFVLYIYLGRVLSPEAYGYLSYILAVSAYFVLLVEVGLPKLGVREVAAHPGLSLPLFQTITGLKLTLFLVVSLMWVLYIGFSSEPYRWIALLLIGYFFARAIDLQWLLQAQQQFTTIALLRIMKAAILLVSLVVLYFSPTLVAYLLLFVSAALIPTVWYAYRAGLWRRFKYLKQRVISKEYLLRSKTLFYKSLPLTASSFLVLMYYNLDTILIRYFLDLEAVARYTAAYKLVFAFIVARNLLHSIVFPRISKAKFEWKEGRHFFIFSLFVAVVIVLIAWFFSEEILQFAYQDKYLSSVNVFVILSLTASVLWLNLFFPVFFIAIKREYFYLKVQLFTTMLNVVANIWLIPIYGIEGAAWATLMADIVSLVIFGISYYVVRYK